MLFLCTGNSARSQMAEAWLRALGDPAFEAASAGTEPSAINPLTVRVMAESGIDVSRAESKHLDRYVQQPWDLVVTVCDRAQESCPLFPGAASQQHWGFPDPAAFAGSEEQRLAEFRRVRDDIRARIEQFLGEARVAP